ncbi:hypothetical protein C6P52_08510 [Enterococcus mundtii]|nr:hypothetical protein C6P52_08510 [Enterococcus mundtii]PTO45056.1 hypothetical protein C6P54_01695 [Enterococcus mundtii]
MGQKCLTSRNKAPSTKIIFQIFVNGALFFEEVTSVPAVYLVLGGAKGRMSQTREVPLFCCCQALNRAMID